ncbi:kinase D-interacting substrate of 220 kDa-like [Haliotis rubra]|uniref:kinase D-interacting substrate of 220 kDa-like n=1 Tax=Haliotis rubra TaxID=36100 RepID=UPI001EE5112D|nr:kinase D-interacting substrate of 220 kDa-like [Haliotis rubra]
MCSFGQRCLKTRSGKTVCVQGQKQNYPEGSPQHEVDKEETFVNSPLHDACRKGNLTRVRSILSQGLVDINIRDGNHGKTPLMVAAQEGHCRILSFLIRKGANMSQVDNDGKNFLHWACNCGHVGMAECLLPQYDIDINHKHVSPLLQAAYRGSKDVFEFLVCMGANVSQVDDRGDKVLHWGCKGGHLGMVKYLLSLCSVDINSSGKMGVTPLMWAALYGYRDIFQFLVRMGASLSQLDDMRNNILHRASLAGRLEMVKYIIRQNTVNINARNKDGETAAMIAKSGNKSRVYNFLVLWGCPVK